MQQNVQGFGNQKTSSCTEKDQTLELKKEDKVSQTTSSNIGVQSGTFGHQEV